MNKENRKCMKVIACGNEPYHLMLSQDIGSKPFSTVLGVVDCRFLHINRVLGFAFNLSKYFELVM